MAADADTFLGWDLDYADAKLTQFDAGDIDEYLLRWCPRKLLFPPAEWIGVVDGLVAYLQFLVASSNWSGPSKLATRVAAHARAPAFSGADIDFNDPASLQAAVDRYNSLPFDERKAMTDPFMMGLALTATGNLKMADCRVLTDLLQTGDLSQVRSMNQLRNLAFIFDVAVETRATEMVGSPRADGSRRRW